MKATLVRILAASLLALGVSGCDLLLFGGKDPVPTSCQPATWRTCSDWRCADGMLLNFLPEAGALEGTFMTADAKHYVRFSVKTLSTGAAEARFESDDETCLLTASVTGSEQGKVTWSGMEIDGMGELTAAEREALTRLNASHLVDALVRVPLDLGCDPDLAPEHLAALLLPWQLLLKYDTSPDSRVSAVSSLGSRSQCKYFTDERIDDRAGSLMGPMQLGEDRWFPNVFGYFPFDEKGALEPAPQQGLAGDLLGPCGAKCRGACGADCPKGNCTVTTLDKCVTQSDGTQRPVKSTTYACGAHEGCIQHDDCYDLCHTTHGCGTWSAAICRRGCDLEAVDKWGAGNGVSWAGGGGPYSSTLSFTYETLGPASACMGCVAPGTLVSMADGSQLPIERVSPGSRIAAVDLASLACTVATVGLLLEHRDRTYELADLQLDGGGNLSITGNHPVWTVADGFKPVDDLEPGDDLLLLDEATGALLPRRIGAIVRRASESGVVYNLKTSQGNYFAEDVLVHNKCLAAGSRIDTPEGPVPVESLRPGQAVFGREGGRKVVTQVRSVFSKRTVMSSLPGRRLSPGLLVTANHPVELDGRCQSAGSLDFPSERVSGVVYDLETATGNYYASGILLGSE
jgi:hypothetical protein